MPESQRIRIVTDLDIVAARIEGRNLAREMGFGIIDQARIATAISELARNLISYAHGGEILLSRVEPNGRAGIQIVCEDQGPGIQDVDRILARRSPAGPEEGMGLWGTRRLMDEFEIQSQIGVGTRIVALKWLR